MINELQDTELVTIDLNPEKVVEGVGTYATMTYANLKLLEAEGAKWDGDKVVTGE
tara:strand:+ start:671 stop:835 length:165 start_codon:yes stop_codon:yes gene_type:complete